MVEFTWPGKKRIFVFQSSIWIISIQALGQAAKHLGEDEIHNDERQECSQVPGADWELFSFTNRHICGGIIQIMSGHSFCTTLKSDN